MGKALGNKGKGIVLKNFTALRLRVSEGSGLFPTNIQSRTLQLLLHQTPRLKQF